MLFLFTGLLRAGVRSRRIRWRNKSLTRRSRISVRGLLLTLAGCPRREVEVEGEGRDPVSGRRVPG